MRSVIVVHPEFDRIWPFAADHFHDRWAAGGPVEFIRLDDADRRPLGATVDRPATVTRLAALGVTMTAACAGALTGLREIASEPPPPDDVAAATRRRVSGGSRSPNSPWR